MDVLFIPPRTRDMYSLVAKTWCPDRLMPSTRMLSMAWMPLAGPAGEDDVDRIGLVLHAISLRPVCTLNY